MKLNRTKSDTNTLSQLEVFIALEFDIKLFQARVGGNDLGQHG